jgi:hypothetical protein
MSILKLRAPWMVFLGVLIAPALGLAAKPAPTRAPVIQSLLDCRAVSDSAGRLACYDKAVASLDQAEHSGDLVTIDREQRREVRRQAFGLTLPSLAMFDRGEKTEETEKVTVKLASARLDPLGKWIIELDDGAVWRQIDDNALYRKPIKGVMAIVHRGALGSYLMNIDGQQAIRVHRDR